MNSQISASRLPHYLPKFIQKEVVAEQATDIVIRKDRKNGYSLIYLPLDYHRQNPGYLEFMIDKSETEIKKGSVQASKVLVLVLSENKEEVVCVGEAQKICLRKNTNMLLCFDIKEVANTIVDLL